MAGKRLQWVCGLGIVVREEEIAYAIVECIVKAALALKSVSLTQCARLEEEAHDFVVAAQACLAKGGNIQHLNRYEILALAI